MQNQVFERKINDATSTFNLPFNPSHFIVSNLHGTSHYTHVPPIWDFLLIFRLELSNPREKCSPSFLYNEIHELVC